MIIFYNILYDSIFCITQLFLEHVIPFEFYSPRVSPRA